MNKNSNEKEILYPVLVRMSKAVIMELNNKLEPINESTDISISFIAVQSVEQIREKNNFYIFVSRETFSELQKNKMFAPHYEFSRGKSNWYTVKDMSNEAKSDLLRTAMSSNNALLFSCENWIR